MPNWTEADIDLVLNGEKGDSEEGGAIVADLEDAALDQFQDAVTALSKAVTAMVLESLDVYGRLLPADTELDPQAEWGATGDGGKMLFADQGSATRYASGNDAPLLTREVRSWASGARYIGAWHVVPVPGKEAQFVADALAGAEQHETDNH